VGAHPPFVRRHFLGEAYRGRGLRLVLPLCETLSASMDLVINLLKFGNSVAEGIGLLILSAVRFVVPAPTSVGDLAAPIGWLALVTAGLAMAEVVRKLAWVVVGAGWLLVMIRIVMGVVGR